jgi:sugar (pentulose or hexulose) kinase
MSAVPVIAIFDVGKTNKKLFLFDENYRIVYERSARFIETVDEDGDTCENLESLRLSVFDSLSEVFKLKEYRIKAINFSAYGASFVYIGEDGKPLTPLYNYLKTYPEELSNYLYDNYGGKEEFSIKTASPILGSLNSGLQLFRLKREKPEIFKKVKYALHLPQYLSYLICGEAYSDLTSIGCHTAMWNFEINNYHQWLIDEGIDNKLATIVQGNKTSPAIFPGSDIKVGLGLHDSSAALIPYVFNFSESFVLISTGTWCISLNPFNQSSLTADELKKDCLCYLQYNGNPVKASRLFSGFEHEQQAKRIADHFSVDVIKFRAIAFDPEIIANLKKDQPQATETNIFNATSMFQNRNLADFNNDTEAYHQLILDMIQLQVISTQLVLDTNLVKRIFVDGGFSKNSIYMNLLAINFPFIEVFAASMAQATAMGAALAIHSAWNIKAIPNDIIELKYYSSNQTISL